MNYKILIVDDDRDLQMMLKRYLEKRGYEILQAEDGIEAFDKLAVCPDIILLDVNMPKMDGIEFCRAIRHKISCPIIFLTAKAEEQDRVNGLLSGGDDYVVKPFSLKELDARIKAHISREERAMGKAELKLRGGFVIDYSDKSMEYEGQKVELTRTEFAIVEFLSMHAGQVFDRERIYENVCGYDAIGDSRGITELIRRIRNKMARFSEEDVIETVWGNGYKWKK